MATRDIMKHADDDVLIYSLTTTSSILQYLLSLVEVDKCFFGTLNVDTFLGVAAKFDHSLQEFLYLD